jgi:hypothetical protein
MINKQYINQYIYINTYYTYSLFTLRCVLVYEHIHILKYSTRHINVYIYISIQKHARGCLDNMWGIPLAIYCNIDISNGMLWKLVHV